MSTKTKSGTQEAASPRMPDNFNDQIRRKDKDKSLMYKILYLLFCQKGTAAELNDFAGASDSRKLISLLRREGHQILDYKRDDRQKVYFTMHSLKSEFFNTDDANFNCKIGGIHKHPNTNSYE